MERKKHETIVEGTITNAISDRKFTLPIALNLRASQREKQDEKALIIVSVNYRHKVI